MLDWEQPLILSYPNRSKTEFIFHFIEIPVKVNWNINIKKTDFYITAGLSLNNFTNKTTTIYSFTENKNQLENKDQNNYGYRYYTISGLLGLGMNFPLFKRWTMSIEPIFSRQMNAIVADMDAKEYIYSLGCNTKLWVQFKKKRK